VRRFFRWLVGVPIAVFVIGLLVGWFGSWLAQGKWRKAARDSRSEVAQLQQELADLRRNDPREQPRDVTVFPGGLM
jgi:anti-sigma factor RsiW